MRRIRLAEGRRNAVPVIRNRFSVRALELGDEFARYSPIVRLQQELKYARIAARAVLDAQPDVAVLSNVPLLSLFFLTWALRRRRVPYVFWQQDVYSDAIGVVARQRLGRLGGLSAGSRSVPSARSPAARRVSSPSARRSSNNSTAWGVRQRR